MALIMMVTVMMAAVADVNLRKVKGNIEFYDTNTNETIIYDINQVAEWMQVYSSILDQWKEIHAKAIKQLNDFENLKVKVQNASKAEYKMMLTLCESDQDAYDMIKAARNNTSCNVIKETKARKVESEKEIKRIQKQLSMVHDYLESNF